MNAHIFWPPLAVLTMAIMVLIFIILKYGDKLFKARTTPLDRSYDYEQQSSENTAYDEDRTVEEYEDHEEEEEEEEFDYEPDQEKNMMEIIPMREKYEYAV